MRYGLLLMSGITDQKESGQLSLGFEVHPESRRSLVGDERTG